ncbi:AAA family ATPase [Candidatus Poribacteria bacterium]
MEPNRVLPNNINAERAVLGAMLMPDEGASAIQKVLDTGLAVPHFYKEGHQIIFDAILSLYNRDEPADLLTVTTQLEQAGNVKKAGGVIYLDEMIDAVPTAANVAYYANIVLEASARRSIIKQLAMIDGKADDETVELVEIMEDIEQIGGSLPSLSKNWQRKRAIDAESFCQMDMQDIPMIVGDGLIPAFGYTMLAGYAKSGKTTLCMQLCLSIATGEPFLNTFPIEHPGANVLYCYLENSDNGIRKILAEQRQNWGSPVKELKNLYLLDAKGLCLQHQADLRYLSDVIREECIKLCIIDPVSLAMRGDQNDYSVVRSLVNALQEIGQKAGVAFLLIHHFHKPSVVKRDAIHAMIGSSAWGNFAESVIGVERWAQNKPKDYQRLSFVLRTAQAPEDLCVYRNTHNLFELVDSHDNMPSEKIMSVVDVMKEHCKPLSYSLLIELVIKETEITDRQARRIIAAALGDGHIQKEPGKRGNYYLPPKHMSDVLFDR